MNYLISNFEEYVLTLLGIVGEIDYEFFRSSGLYSEDVVRKKTKNLIDEKVIIKSKVNIDDEEEFGIRVSAAEGYKMIEQLSHELRLHFDLLENSSEKGKPPHFYKGTSENKAKKYEDSSEYLRIALMNVPIDLLFFIYSRGYISGWRKGKYEIANKGESIFKEDGSLKEAADVLEGISDSKERFSFFTKNFLLSGRESLKYEESGKTIKRTTSIGIFVRGDRYCPVYYLSRRRSRWYQDPERTWAGWIVDLQQRIYPASSRNRYAIFFAKDSMEMKSLLEQPDKIGILKNATEIYESIYLLSHSDDAQLQIEMIFSKEKENLVIEDAIGCSLSEELYLAGQFGGKDVYSLLKNDINELFVLKEKGIGEESIVIVFEWQVDIVLEFLPHVNLIVYTKEEVEAIYKKGME